MTHATRFLVHGASPEPGGALDQSDAFWRVVEVVGRVKGEAEAEAIRKAKARRG